MTVGLGAAMGILGIHTVLDIRRRKINLIFAIMCLAAGMIWQMAGQNAGIWELVLSCIPGVFLLGAAWLTEEKIGYGDGWIVIATGSWTGFWDIFFILTGGMVICALFSGALLSMKKMKRGDSLPFIPFLLAGCIARLVI